MHAVVTAAAARLILLCAVTAAATKTFRGIEGMHPIVALSQAIAAILGALGAIVTSGSVPKTGEHGPGGAVLAEGI